jgi:hypothetical protein
MLGPEDLSPLASPGLVAGRPLGLRQAPHRIAEGDLMHLRQVAPLVLGLVPPRIQQAQRWPRSSHR